MGEPAILNKLFRFWQHKRDYSLVALIFCLGLISYSRSLVMDFPYSDFYRIIQNPFLTSVDLSVLKVYDVWQIIPNFSFAFLARFSSLGVHSWHLFNILIHIANAILAFYLSKIIFRTLKREESSIDHESVAIFTALLFLLH